MKEVLPTTLDAPTTQHICDGENEGRRCSQSWCFQINRNCGETPCSLRQLRPRRQMTVVFPFPPLRTDGRTDWVLNQKSLAARARRGTDGRGIKLPAETLKGLEQRATRTAFCVRGPLQRSRPTEARKRGTGYGRRTTSPLQNRTENDSVSYPTDSLSSSPS